METFTRTWKHSADVKELKNIVASTVDMALNIRKIIKGNLSTTHNWTLNQRILT